MGFLDGIVFQYFGSKFVNSISKREGKKIADFAVEIIERFGEKVERAGIDVQIITEVGLKHNNQDKLENFRNSKNLDYSTKNLIKIGEPIFYLLNETGLDYCFLLTDVNDQYLTYSENIEDSNLIVRLYKNKVQFLNNEDELLSESKSGLKHMEINFFRYFRDSYLSIK